MNRKHHEKDYDNHNHSDDEVSTHHSADDAGDARTIAFHKRSMVAVVGIVRITSGKTSAQKTVEIDGLEHEEVVCRFSVIG